MNDDSHLYMSSENTNAQTPDKLQAAADQEGVLGSFCVRNTSFRNIVDGFPSAFTKAWALKCVHIQTEFKVSETEGRECSQK